ncbi:MAG: DNA repair protein RadA, partial [Acetobacter okinawensis]
MAKKTSRQYVCRACGAVHAKWAGQCDACQEWNTLEEMAVEPLAASSATTRSGKGRRVQLHGLGGKVELPPRTGTGIAELDRVLGGGLVPASV